ncbi:MAG: DUF3644 domain-containing protein [Candidatus Gracilibacteria bacterium]|nr:DUF3644 domain-containing protein [Candidatus Gracilibacteria bacterium]
MKRKPNIADTLLKNSISAIFSAIEIHNKPNISYRYPTVTILILNSWELLLKSYIYKVKKDKTIIKIQKGNGRYPSLQHCINKIFIGDDLLVFKNNIESIAEYRNLIIHAFTEDLDEIIFSIINKNIELYGNFLKDFLDSDINKFGDNLILLPIGFNKPFNPASFLSKKGISKSFSEEIGKFLNNIVLITKKLDEKNIDETILIPFKLDIVSKNKITNPDIIAKIEKNAEWGFSKETKISYSNEPGVQQVRTLSLEESKKLFNINYNELILILKEKYGVLKKTKEVNNKYKEIKKEDNYQKLWYTNPINKKISFHKDIKNNLGS